MRARQLQRRDEDLQEAALYLRRSREQGKDNFDSQKRLRVKELNVRDLVLLHDTKLKYQYSHKLDYRWLGPYQLADLVRDKRTYLLKELDGARLQGTYTRNRLKFFYTRGLIDVQEMTTNERREETNLTDEADQSDLRAHISEGWNMAVVIPLKDHDEMETFAPTE